MHFNGQTLSDVFEQFSFTSNFFELKMQKSTFCKKNSFKSSFFFIKLTFRWLQTGLSDLKNTKQLKKNLRILKCCIFHFFFEIFEIHQYFLVKLLNALNFMNTVGQTQ